MAREEQRPMSDARLAADVLRRWFLSNDAIDSDQLQDAVRTAIDALADNERLRSREAALVEMAQAVAEADNSDNSVCYQVCDYSMHGDWMIEHEAPCVVKQARALLASEADEAK